MKNKILYIFICLFFINNSAISNELEFETKKIQIIDNGNQIDAGKGRVFSKIENFEIFADKFNYKKNLNLLNSSGNGLLILKSKNLTINFDNLSYDEKNLIFKANGNIRIKQLDEKFTANTDNIIFDKKVNLIFFNNKTQVIDRYDNIYSAEKIVYEIDKELLKLKNVLIVNKKKDRLRTLDAYLEVNSDKLYAKDFKLNLNNSTETNLNEPRLKGNSVVMSDKQKIITKGVFTNCKKRDDCPPWQIKSKKIIHDEEKKIIFYENAVLELYDKPIFYFPKFFHPDPSVKRQSGFLIPSLKSSNNSENFLNTPYFLVLAENKDATFSPRFYDKNKFLLQSEFRQINKKSDHIIDTSFFNEKNKNSHNHFFYRYNNLLNFKKFDESKIKIRFENVSSDTYLENNKLNSPIISDYNNLENSIGLELYSDNLSINLETTVYEDLNKLNNDRYEYIFPKINIIKNIGSSSILDGNFILESDNQIRQYDTNINEVINTNNVQFNSNSKTYKFGAISNYDILLRNTNSDANNSKKFKEKTNFSLSGIYQYNLSLPLFKKNIHNEKTLIPKISLKLSPNYTKDQSNQEVELDVNNIFNLERIGDDNSLEGGISLAYGTDYSVFNFKNNREIINFKLANNFRLRENKDLPKTNQINQKTSNIFNEITLSPNDFVNTTYKSSIKNNLSDIESENIITEFRINNIVASFDYLNRNNSSDNNSYLTRKINYSINESNSFSFATRENKTIDLTEFYNFMYQYKNDCLTASIEYNKEFYEDREIKPNESLLFKITIIPIAEVNTPNLAK